MSCPEKYNAHPGKPNAKQCARSCALRGFDIRRMRHIVLHARTREHGFARKAASHAVNVRALCYAQDELLGFD